MYEPFVSKGHAITGEDKGILADISEDYSILLMNYAESIITSVDTAVVERMEPYFGQVGTSYRVTVTASNLTYGDDFAVTFDGEEVEVLRKESTYFTFDTPADKPVGEYDVVITNGGGIQSKAGIFTVQPVPDDDAPVIKRASPYKFEEHVNTRITVAGSNFIEPTVYLGDTEMTVNSFTDTVIKFDTGSDIPAGKYQLKVVNSNGKSASAAEYFVVYYGEVSEPPTITSVSPTEFPEHYSQAIAIRGTKFSSPTVRLGGKEIKVVTCSSTLITCRTDDSFEDGTYTLTLFNGDGVTLTLHNAITIDMVLPAPTIKDIVYEDGAVKLTWTADEGDEFEIFRATSIAGTKTSLGRVDCNDFIDATAVAGTTYYYFVKAYTTIDEKEIESDYSDYYKFGVEVPKLEAPVFTDGTYDDLKIVTVTWNPVDNADSYDVYRADSPAGAKKLLGNTEDTSFCDMTAKEGGKFFYFVKAKNSEFGVESPFSAYIVVSVPKAAEVVVKPEIESVVYADGKVTVTVKEAEGAAAYTLFRSESVLGTKTPLGDTTGLSYQDADVTQGKKYFYFVKITLADGSETDYSAYKYITVPKTTVTASKAEIDSVSYVDGKVKVTVKEFPGAAAYKLYRSTSVSGTKEELGEVTGLTYVDTSAKNGTKYFYFLKVTKDDGTDTAYSAYKYITVPKAPVVAAKAEIETVAYADGKVTVTVKEFDGAAAYTIYRAESAAGTKTKLGTATGLTYEDNGLTAGKRYFYFVQITKADGTNTAYSAYKTVDIPKVTVSANPQIENAVYSYGKVTVTIREYAGAVSYKLYRSESETGTKATVATVTGLSYEDAGLTQGKTYYYYVKAVKADGTETDFSEHADVFVPVAGSVSTRPVIASVTSSGGVVTVKISAYAGAARFDVYRSTTSSGTKTNLGSTSTTTFEDTTAVAGKRYYYFIKAINTAGAESTFSASKNLTV